MVKSKLVKITPAKAKEMLKQNTNNRRMQWHRVGFYAEEMKGGRWKSNGESIKFSGSRIIDGQHRLAAVVKYGKPVVMMVATGLNSDAFDTIDRGMIRTTAQILNIAGEANATTLGASVSMIIRYLHPGSATTKKQRMVSPSEVQAFVGKNPRVKTIVAWAMALRKSSLTTCSLLAAARFLFEKSNRAESNKYFEKFISGNNLGKTDPIGALRQTLIQYKNLKARLAPPEILVYMIITWNLIITGKRCATSTIKFPKDCKMPRIKRK